MKPAKPNIWNRPSERGSLPGVVDQVLPRDWNRFAVDIVKYIDAQHSVEQLTPQANWVFGAPMGNGDLGVMAYGATEALQFNFAKNDLWDWRPFGEPNFPAVDFATLREVLSSGDERRFQKILAATNKKARRDTPTGKPGGLLRLELFASSLASHFTQRLSLAHGETITTWRVNGDRKGELRSPDNTVTVVSFVHAAQNVLVVHVVPARRMSWHNDVEFCLWRPRDPEMDAPKNRIERDRLSVRQELPGGEHFVLMGAVDSRDFLFEMTQGKLHGIGVPKSPTLTFYVTLVTSRDAKDPRAQAERNLDAALSTGCETLRATHRRWWHNYWERGFVCSPWKTVERAWYYGLYLHASSSRPGRQSPALFLNQNKENHPAWNADYHTNGNIQGFYWSQYTANRLELCEPLYRLVMDVLPQCRKDTAAYFKMRGARYPISMGPDGIETAPGVLLSTWIGGGGWLAEHFWWHYKFSGDREFLRTRAYPLLKECALFYEDYLQEAVAGKLCLFPTIQCEIATSSLAGVGRNSSWDLPIVTRTFQMALDAAIELKIDANARTRWRKILDRLPSIPATSDGVWTEFADKGGLWHQWDFTRFMPIFPMELVGPSHGSEPLQQQARATIEEFLQYRRAWDKDPWIVSMFGTFISVSLLRFGYIEQGVKLAENILRVAGEAMFGSKREWAFSGVDATAYVIFLNEMLLQSYDGVLRVFPAVPATESNACFHSLRAQGGFLVTAERRNNLTQYVIIQSLCGNPLRLLNPFVGEPDRGVEVKVYELTAGARFDTVEDQARQHPIYDRIHVPGQIIEFPTKPDRVYLISKEIPWISNIPPLEIK